MSWSGLWRDLGQGMAGPWHRGEGEEIRPAVIMERALAEEIAGEDEVVPGGVPEGEGEIAGQPIHRPFAPAEERSHQHRGVRLAGEVGLRAVEVAPEILAVVEADVRDKGKAAVFEDDRADVEAVFRQRRMEIAAQRERSVRPASGFAAAVDPLSAEHPLAPADRSGRPAKLSMPARAVIGWVWVGERCASGGW